MDSFDKSDTSEIERTVEYMEEIHTKIGSGEYNTARHLAEELSEGASCELCEALGTSMMGASIWVMAMPMGDAEPRAQCVMDSVEHWLEEIGRPILEEAG